MDLQPTVSMCAHSASMSAIRISSHPSWPSAAPNRPTSSIWSFINLQRADEVPAGEGGGGGGGGKCDDKAEIVVHC